MAVPPAIGVSRVYVVAHDPTDVLAGLALGGAWVWACARFLVHSPAHGAVEDNRP